MRPALLTLGLLLGCAEDLPATLDSGSSGTASASGTTTTEAPDGAALYGLSCAGCHGADGRGGAGGPDLLDRAAELSVTEIVSVILDGAGFMDPVSLSEGEAAAVAHYVVDEIVGG